LKKGSGGGTISASSDKDRKNPAACGDALSHALSEQLGTSIGWRRRLLGFGGLVEEILKEVTKLVELAKGALRKGLVEIALLRYGIALGLLRGLLLSSQTFEVDLTEDDDLDLIAMINRLEGEAQIIVDDWGNGHRNPPRHGVARAGEEMLKELNKLRDLLS
jgi:hypothetical protein